jgi:hypothetical protein
MFGTFSIDLYDRFVFIGKKKVLDEFTLKEKY